MQKESPDPAAEVRTHPLISVVVPVRNEGRFIEQTLRAILDQDYPGDKLEILVVDGMSDDDTADIIQELARSHDAIRFYSNPARIASAARNIGVRQARGQIVLFIDGHVYIDNDQLLMETARLMHDKDVSVLSRPQFLETPHNTPLQNAIAYARRSRFGHGHDSTIYLDREAYVDPASSGAAYRRELFDAVGYFDEAFDASEDYEFNYRLSRAGYRAFTSPALAVYYYPRTSIRGLFRQMRRYGLGRFRLARKHPSTISPASMAPAGLTILLALLPLALALDVARAPIVLLSLIYVTSVCLSSLIVAWRHGMGDLLRLLIVFPAIHIGLGVGFLSGIAEALTGRRLR